MKIQVVWFFLLIPYLTIIISMQILKVKLLIVTSNSMKPEFVFGDVLLAKSQEQYSPNDIVSYEIEGITVTHRIVSIHKSSETLYEVKGDANTFSDLSLIKKEQVIGKIFFSIPKIGFLVLFMKSKYSLLLILTGSIFYLSFVVGNKIKSFKEKNI